MPAALVLRFGQAFPHQQLRNHHLDPALLTRGVTLIGLGVIIVGAQAARKGFGLALDAFWLIVGILFVSLRMSVRESRHPLGGGPSAYRRAVRRRTRGVGMKDFPQAAARRSVALRGATWRRTRASKLPWPDSSRAFLFIVTALRYAALSFAVEVAGLSKLLKLFGGDLDVFEPFLDMYLPGVFMQSIGAADSPNAASFTIEPDSRELSVGSKTDRRELAIGSVPSRPTSERSGRFGKVANYSLPSGSRLVLGGLVRGVQGELE